MSYAIINARRYFVLLNYQYGLKRKKSSDGGWRVSNPGPQGYKAPTFPLHHSIGFSSMSGIEYFITSYPMF